MLVGLDLPLVGVGTEAGVWSPHQGNCLSQRRNTEGWEGNSWSWQPKWNENQIVLAAIIHTLEGAVAGSWSLGIVEQSQGEGCCWLWRDGLRGCEGGDHGGKCLWRKAGQPWKQGDPAESYVGSGAVTVASLSTHQHRQLNNREAGPSDAWRTELQSKTPPRVPL